MAKTFAQWYSGNKATLAAKRKKRYQEDAEFRQAVKQRSSEWRERRREEKPKVVVDGLTAAQVCEHLEITDWTLTRWRKNDYFPAPNTVNGMRVFSAKQLDLLAMIKAFFKQYPKRSAGLHKDDLQNLVDVIHHNWSL